MTLRYVGAGGNDANTGLSWAQRKLTLNGVEDSPVQVGDVVYIAPGVYRETLTVDVSGALGSPITYIGDVTGEHTDGVGGIVRITGSDNDQTAVRNKAITAGDKDFRSFQGLAVDLVADNAIYTNGGCANWILDRIFIDVGPSANIIFAQSPTNITIKNCLLFGRGVGLESNATQNDANILIENCILAFGPKNGFYGIYDARIGGVTVKNCLIAGHESGVAVTQALAAGQTVNVNNCIFWNNQVALQATALGEITEDYNAFYLNQTARSNTATGAHSNAYPPLFDPRWFFKTVAGGKLVTPFDLSSFSQLVNLAGTSPSAADMRGSGAIGAQREWGPLEYDPDLVTTAGTGGVDLPDAMTVGA